MLPAQDPLANHDSTHFIPIKKICCWPLSGVTTSLCTARCLLHPSLLQHCHEYQPSAKCHVSSKGWKMALERQEIERRAGQGIWGVQLQIPGFMSILSGLCHVPSKPLCSAKRSSLHLATRAQSQTPKIRASPVTSHPSLAGDQIMQNNYRSAFPDHPLPHHPAMLELLHHNLKNTPIQAVNLILISISGTAGRHSGSERKCCQGETPGSIKNPSPLLFVSIFLSVKRVSNGQLVSFTSMDDAKMYCTFKISLGITCCWKYDNTFKYILIYHMDYILIP